MARLVTRKARAGIVGDVGDPKLVVLADDADHNVMRLPAMLDRLEFRRGLRCLRGLQPCLLLVERFDMAGGCLAVAFGVNVRAFMGAAVRTRTAGDYPGNGIAIDTRIDSTVSVTAKHSDKAPIASVAAIALVNREDATGAGRPEKPTVPDDRIMVQFLQDAGESPAMSGNFAESAGNIAARSAWKTWKRCNR